MRGWVSEREGQQRSSQWCYRSSCRHLDSLGPSPAVPVGPTPDWTGLHGLQDVRNKQDNIIYCQNSTLYTFLFNRHPALTPDHWPMFVCHWSINLSSLLFAWLWLFLEVGRFLSLVTKPLILWQNSNTKVTRYKTGIWVFCLRISIFNSSHLPKKSWSLRFFYKLYWEISHNDTAPPTTKLKIKESRAKPSEKGLLQHLNTCGVSPYVPPLNQTHQWIFYKVKNLSRLTQTLQVTSSILVQVLHVCHMDSAADLSSHPAVFALCWFIPTFSWGERPGKQRMETLLQETWSYDVKTHLVFPSL